ncbi:MAG: WD40 repeat domain-containing protein, partial [Candidatus Sericytochromatia bacterium]|nr:WD40 repeat domain-containing protein [Candidatus Sericytochromatia bacterium]
TSAVPVQTPTPAPTPTPLPSPGLRFTYRMALAPGDQVDFLDVSGDRKAIALARKTDGLVRIYRGDDGGLTLAWDVGQPVRSIWLTSRLLEPGYQVLIGTSAGTVALRTLPDLDNGGVSTAVSSESVGGAQVAVTGILGFANETRYWRIGSDGLAQLRSWQTGTLVSLPAFGALYAMDAQITRLAYGGEDRLLRVVDIADGREIMTSLPLGRSVDALALSGDAARVVVGDRDGKVVVITVPDGITLREWRADAAVLALAMSPDGRYVAYGGLDNRVTVARVADGAIVALPWIGTVKVTGLRFSTGARATDNGDRLYVATDGEGVLTYDVTWD